MANEIPTALDALFISGQYKYSNVVLLRREITRITGAGVTVADDPTTGETVITIPGVSGVTDASAISTGTLAQARGGTGISITAQTGIIKYTSGTPSLVTVPAGALVGTSEPQTLTNKSLTNPTMTGTATIADVTISGSITIGGAVRSVTGDDPSIQGFRLTLSSGNPLPTSDVSNTI